MLRNQIEAVVQSLSAQPSFLYGTANELNTLSDKTVFPCVFLYALSPLELSFRKTLSLDHNYSLYMAFLYQTPFASYTAENEGVVLQAVAMMEEFLIKLANYREDNGRFFRINTDTKAQAIALYDKFNVNLTGVDLKISLSPMYTNPVSLAPAL